MIKYFFIVLFYISCKQNTINLSREDLLHSKQIDSIKNITAEGDILFRGGTDIESDIIREFSITNKTFSHCGIVVKKDGKLKIAHILGGYTNISGSLLYQSVDSFLSYPNNESAGIYTANLLPRQIEKVGYFIDSLRNADVIFDIKFNLFTKDKLYCTELIVDVLSYVKRDVNLFRPTKYNLVNTKYSFLVNSKNDFLFYPIDEFGHNKNLQLKKIFFFPNYNMKKAQKRLL
jgi:hypothetical protein